ncbi:MAG: branched-chain amino acid aminotransferase [Lactimicrobium massiliense]|nr:branched-chain amino acid aminotransferase [Lactimicrobium massiliense]MDD6560304.1 branched-chain amino acid aminotransferase [Lactimicrobium massiliense]
MLKIKITQTKSFKPKPKDETQLGFGKYFTDHMFLMDWDAKRGWHDARIEPYHSFQLDPCAGVFHYGQEVFEGIKAYRTKDDRILLFRPWDNAERFQKSAERMCIPPVLQSDFIDGIKALIQIDRDWIPHRFGTSLYLRPFIIATGTGFGAKASSAYRFVIIASPSGCYYENGLEPIKVYVEDKYIRTAPGLAGYAKCGGNYAASMKSMAKANQLGYDQVLWLDGIHHCYVEEAGSMNVFFLKDNVLYTAPCEGTILDGVIRRSVITLAKEHGIETKEMHIDIDDVMKDGKDGSLQECFGTSTAALIAPIGELRYHDESVVISQGRIGPVSQMLYGRLSGIQWGREEDPYHWTVEAVKK